MTDNSKDNMQLAINEAKKAPEGSPRVGTVIVKNGRVLAKAYRGKYGEHLHAEHCALIEAKNAGTNIRGATVYTTLEPCNEVRSASKVPCADQLIEAGVAEVYIGSYDRNPVVYRQGWRRLRDAGLKLYDFDEQHRQQVKYLNSRSDGNFLYSVGKSGGAKFDYMQNGGKFEVFYDESKAIVFKTRWSQKGPRSIYAYGGQPGIVSLAKYAVNFEEIDDPDAYDYEGSSVSGYEGDIVIFRNAEGHALVKICEVQVGAPWDNKNTSLKIKYQLRLKESSKQS